MLWHIELQFCIWLCFTILQIKFECHQFASIFVGVMPLLELRILEIHSFPHFSLPFFIRPSSDGTYYGMVMSVRPGLRPTLRPSDSPSVRPTLRPSVRLSVRPSDSPSVRVSVRPFSTLFSYTLWHIELKFCTSLCFNVLQIKFECRHFASIFKGVMPLLELRI